MKKLLALVFTLCLAAPSFAQETVISGTLLGHDGAPMTNADVSLYAADRALLRSHAAAPEDGAYRLALDTTGVFSLWFTGVNHHVESVPLLIGEAGQQVEIDARLAAYDYADDFSGLQVIGDFNDFSFRGGAVPMKKQPDGTFAAEAPADGDSLAYQVLGALAGEGRSVNGTQADRYVYDGGGDYRSVLPAGGDSVRVTFDPDQLAESDVEAEVTFGDEDSDAARYADFAQALQERRRAFLQQYREKKEAGATDEEMKAFRNEYNWSENGRLLEEALDAASSKSTRDALRTTYLDKTLRPDSVLAQRALGQVAPPSPAWAVGRSTLGKTVRATGRPDAYDAYLMEALRENPVDGMKASTLSFLLYRAAQNGNDERKRLLYAWLTSAYPNTSAARFARSRFDPDRPVQAGKAVPRFEVTALNDPETTYSPQSMKGRVYLIDFWAVWCGPCIAEMPNLHAAYDEYKDDGFTILSLSFDQKPDDVRAYRDEGEWAMPWKHAFLEGGFDSALAKRFGVVGIPEPVLVGKDGTVLATEGDLRGEDLMETLAEVFDEEDEAEPSGR